MIYTLTLGNYVWLLCYIPPKLLHLRKGYFGSMLVSAQLRTFPPPPPQQSTDNNVGLMFG